VVVDRKYREKKKRWDGNKDKKRNKQTIKASRGTLLDGNMYRRWDERRTLSYRGMRVVLMQMLYALVRVILP